MQETRMKKLTPVLIIKRLEGANVVVPVRKTSYGAREIGVREPGGNVVVFAEMEAGPQK